MEQQPFRVRDQLYTPARGAIRRKIHEYLIHGVATAQYTSSASKCHRLLRGHGMEHAVISDLQLLRRQLVNDSLLHCRQNFNNSTGRPTPVRKMPLVR